jgi:PhnB protein
VAASRVGGRRGVYPLADQFYGERAGRVRDPFGQQWMLGERIETVPPDEMQRRSDEFLSSS